MKSVKRPCIAIDVSKGQSHIQAFTDSEVNISKVKVINHDLGGFNQIIELAQNVEKKTGQVPVVVFEATGIYHRGLQSFLEKNNITYFIVNPLQSAKFRKQNLRTAKTDKRDCKNLSRVYFGIKLRESKMQDDKYYELRQLSRFYEDNLVHLRKCKVSFNETLDIVFPGYRKVFQEVYCKAALETLKKYPHPEMIVNKKPQSIAKYMMSKSEHREEYCLKKANELIALAKQCVSGCRVNDINVHILKNQISQIENYLEISETTLNTLINLAQELPNFHIIKSIPGIGDNLAARILAEIGDISNFTGPKQLVAYAGVDPIIYQSGKDNGEHRKISKKGNKRLRCLLYLAVSCILRSKTSSTSIRTFYQKNTQQTSPLNSKAASLACTNKLLRIIYGMCKTGCVYSQSVEIAVLP